MLLEVERKAGFEVPISSSQQFFNNNSANMIINMLPIRDVRFGIKFFMYEMVLTGGKI